MLSSFGFKSTTFFTKSASSFMVVADIPKEYGMSMNRQLLNRGGAITASPKPRESSLPGESQRCRKRCTSSLSQASVS
jgi:hypothetical protein